MGAIAPKSLSIVLIEDNADTADLLSLVLEHHGYGVRSAPDGASGLQLIETCEPDVVLSDLALPGDIDGYQIAQTLLQKSRAGSRRPFVVALSGYARAADKQRAQEAGFDAHLSKPVDPAALVALLVRVSMWREQGSQATQQTQLDVE
jgi:CheY-like chemotaxis protein